MNREQTNKILPILQAFAEGKVIQYRPWSGTWEDIQDINAEFASTYPDRYRIKPEPRRFTLIVPRKEHPHYASVGTRAVPRGALYNEAFWEKIEVVEVLNG